MHASSGAGPPRCAATMWSSVASRVAASTSSRFSRARDGSRYLSLMTSPCSVTLISPSSVPYGCARIAVRRAAATSDRAAASVEQAEANAVPAADVAQAPLRLVDLPLRRRDTGLLVRVAVAQHHLLDVAPGSDDASVRHVRQECVDDVVCGPQLLRGLQQRHETDPRHARVHIDEPRFPGDQCRGQSIVGPASRRRCTTR